MKKCSRCGQKKPKDCFHRDKNRLDGLYCWCKTCNCNTMKRWWKKNGERINLEKRQKYVPKPKWGPPPIPAIKKCTNCRFDKPINDFYKKSSGRHGYMSYCKSCIDKKNLEYAKKHPQQVKDTSARWRMNNREKDNLRRQLADFGLSKAEYEARLTKQQSLCAICSGDMRPVCIDHCHSTGVVRGLLCRACNTGLGHLRDSTQLLKKALKYLEPFPDGTIVGKQTKTKKQ